MSEGRGARALLRRARERWAEIALGTFAFVLALGQVALVVAPIFTRLDTYGAHDWDQMQAHRYLAVKTIERYHQFPFWDPYSCGGHTWWGGLESGTNVVSPFLPAYLALPLPLALRVEIVGAAVISVIGTWLFAGRFTRSAGARLLACAAFAVDGRWALQISVGHTWHLYYAWVPWALYFLDRAIMRRPGEGRLALRDVALLGGALAMMVYTGAIYPLPQTILVIGVYALACAAWTRSLRPVGLAVAGGAFSFAFAAPRLLPILDMLRRFPRLVDSTATMDLAGLVGIYTARDGDPRPAVGPWAWHEFGNYIGWLPFLLLLAGVLLARRARERALALAGSMCLLVAFGRFSDWSPWGLLHDYVPIFQSQHVPSRWSYPAVLLLIVAFAAVLERWLARTTRRRTLEVGVLFVAAYCALDVGLQAQKPMTGALTRDAPKVKESTGPFHQEKLNVDMRYPQGGDWVAPSMPPMMANVGVIDCGTFPGLDSYYRDAKGRLPGLGAKGRGDPDYRGEVYTLTDVGKVTVDRWTPNAVTVSVHGANVGDVLLLNQNWDPGWTANGKAVLDWGSVVGTHLHEANETIVFRYRPRFFLLGVFLCLATLVGVVVGSRRMKPAPAG